VKAVVCPRYGPPDVLRVEDVPMPVPRRNQIRIRQHAVQLARHLGADVTGVCSGTNLELVRSLGAATVIDYTTADFTRNRQRYDLIFDAVGRRKSSAALVQAGWVLAPGGRCISVDDGTPTLATSDLTMLARLAEAIT
jgi:NADPH:quinone reductase-like Zn-dependent oxidoreductase